MAYEAKLNVRVGQSAHLLSNWVKAVISNKVWCGEACEITDILSAIPQFHTIPQSVPPFLTRFARTP